jgi:hypothetical protein
MTIEADEEQRRRDRAAAERVRQMEETPLQVVDVTKWPKGVRQIGQDEVDGLGIDRDGRLYWNGVMGLHLCIGACWSKRKEPPAPRLRSPH